jgi:hypothetical protein
MLLKFENLNRKHYCPQLWIRPSIRKRPAACLLTPAWARGPAANGWAGETAQRRPPPGLIPAQAAARASPPSIARSTVEIQPADFGGIYMVGQPGKP